MTRARAVKVRPVGDLYTWPSGGWIVTCAIRRARLGWVGQVQYLGGDLTACYGRRLRFWRHRTAVAWQQAQLERRDR